MPRRDQHIPSQSPEDAWNDAVEARVEDLAIRREAKRVDDMTARLRPDARHPIRKVRADSLDELPRRAPLIEGGVLDQGVVAMLSGPTGKGKSFVALDWALSIASSMAWMKHSVVSARVLWVAASGAHSLKKRVEAWRAVHLPTDGLMDMDVIIDPVHLDDPDSVAALTKHIHDGAYGLIVIDGLDKCFSAVDEESASDMSVIIDALYALRDAVEENDATVLVVHHTAYDGRRAHGSSALAAGVDDVYDLYAEDPHDLISVHCSKRRDGEPPFPFLLRLIQVALDEGTSCVVADDLGPEPDDIDDDDLHFGSLSRDVEPAAKAITLILPAGSAGSAFAKSWEFQAVLNRLEAITGFTVNIQEPSA